MKKKNKKNQSNLSNLSKTILGVQAILSVLLFSFIAYSEVLPIWIVVIIAIVLTGTCYFIYFTLNSKKRSKLNINLGRSLSVMFSCILLLANVMAYSAVDALKTVTGANYKIDAISIIVLNSSDASDLNDLKTGVFGFHESNDLGNTNYAIEKINKKLNNEIKEMKFADFSTLVEALYDGSVDAIIMNEAFRGLVEENFELFSTETKVVYQVDKKTAVETTVEKGFDVTKDPFNVYLSGIDTYGPVSTTSRSDVNMIISINPQTKQILLTNIPRDYYVPLACQNGAMDKLTHAGVYGVNCSLETLENFMGIEIPFYGRVNFSSLINIVDALGGIEVYSEYSFTAITGEQFQAGINRMDGESALTFSRERYALPGGDRDRGRNQQAVIQGIVNKAKSPAIVSNYTKVIDAVSGSFQTNMASQDISKLIKMQLGDMADWTISTTSLNGSGTSATTFSYGAQPLYVMIPDMTTVSQAQEKIKEIFGTNLPE